MTARDRLLALIDPVVAGMGYELVGIEFDSGKRILRVYIDHPDGITVDDCARVSYQLSGVLDVEDPIAGRYQLEVSSPGLDRPLFTLAHYARFQGELARVHLHHLVEGRRNLHARILGVDGEHVVFQDGDAIFRIPFAAIERGRLAPDYRGH